MSDVVIAQREYFTQASITTSPAVIANTGRFENWTFTASTITKVEGSVDGVTYVDITTGVGTAFTGGILFRGVCFKFYRVTFTGTLHVNAN